MAAAIKSFEHMEAYTRGVRKGEAIAAKLIDHQIGGQFYVIDERRETLGFFSTKEEAERFVTIMREGHDR